MKNPLTILLVVLVIFGIGSIAFMMHGSKIPRTAHYKDKSNSSANLANPASENCIKKGGQLTIQTLPSGGQYGLCTFEDNDQCEEWALYRGECPVGGLNIIGYDNEQQVYCAITGGKTLAVENATCTLPSGIVCPVDEYYDQTCPSASINGAN